MSSQNIGLNFDFKGLQSLPGFGPNMSTGAQNFITLYGFGNRLVNRVVSEDQGNAALRLVRLLVVTNSMAEWTSSLQGNVNGYGARLREMNIKVQEHGWKPPLAFFEDGASVKFDEGELVKQSKYHQAGFVVADYEARQLMANQVARNALKEGSFSPADSWLFLINQHAGSLRWTESKALARYMDALPHGTATKESLNKMYIANFLGLGTISALSSVMNYVWNGDLSTPLSTFKVQGCEILPDMQVLLAPHGPELGLMTHIKTPDGKIVSASLRGNQTCLSAGVEVDEAWTNDVVTVGGGVEAWSQNGTAGGLVKGSVGWNIDANTTLSFNAAAKTEGYVPGQHVAQGVNFGINLSAKFD